MRVWVAAIAVLVMGAVATGSASAQVPLFAPLKGNEGALSCTGPRTCYGVGQAAGVGDLVTIKNGDQKHFRRIRGTTDVVAISCPTTHFCAAVGYARRGSVLLAITNGVPGKPVRLSWSPTLIACPTKTTCILAGIAGSFIRKIEAAVLSGGVIGKPGVLKVPSTLLGPSLEGLSCASARACEAVGTGGLRTVRSFFVSLSAGAKPGAVPTFGRPHQVNDRAGTILNHGVACPTGSNTCYLTGQNASGGVLESVRLGGSTLTQVAATSADLDYLSCRRLSLCTATATATGAVPAIVSFVHGRPGAEQDFPNLGTLAGFTAVVRVSAGDYVAIATGAQPNASTAISGPAS
jgi:hypothetical protein